MPDVRPALLDPRPVRSSSSTLRPEMAPAGDGYEPVGSGRGRDARAHARAPACGSRASASRCSSAPPGRWARRVRGRSRHRTATSRGIGTTTSPCSPTRRSRGAGRPRPRRRDDVGRDEDRVLRPRPALVGVEHGRVPPTPRSPALSKLRLAGTIFYGSRVKDWKRLEQETVETWLTRWSGRSTFDASGCRCCGPSSARAGAKPNAAFIWATIQRLYAARRTGLKKEMFGYVPGGYARDPRPVRRRCCATGRRDPVRRQCRPHRGRLPPAACAWSSMATSRASTTRSS